MKDVIPSWLEDPRAFAQPPNLDMSTVALVAVFNLLIGVVCVSIFEICGRRWPRVYSPKESRPDVMHAKGKAFGPPLAWIRPLMALSDDQVLEYAGYDALCYLRFVAMATKIFASFAPYAFVVLLPVNASVFLDGDLDDQQQQNQQQGNTFNRLSMSSVPDEDGRTWAHVVGVYLLTGITMHYLSRECQWYTRLRHRFLTQADPRHRTVAVEHVPAELRDSQKLANYFNKLYPGKVVGAVVCRRVADLDVLAADRDAARARLERLEHRLEGDGGVGPPSTSRGENENENDEEYGVVVQNSAAAAAASPRRAVTSWRGLVWSRYSRFLEDLYDPYCFLWKSEQERANVHESQLRRCERYVALEKRRHQAKGPLVARPDESEPPSPSAAARSYDGGATTGLEEDHREEFFDSARSDLDDNEDLPATRKGGLRSLLSCRRLKIPCDEDDDDDGEEAASLLPKKTNKKWRFYSSDTTTTTFSNSQPLQNFQKKLFSNGGGQGVVGQGGSSSFASLSSSSTQTMSPLDGDALDCGFVAMNCFTGAAVATQVFHAATPGGMVATMAPEPKDVFWPNLASRTLSRSKRTTRRVVAEVVVASLLVFYVVPVTLISFVLSEQAVDARWPCIAEVSERSIAVSVGVKMLQPAGLIALMLLLPPFFLGLGFWEGRASWSANTLSQLSRYYAFQITNVLLVTTVAGSLVKCLRRILDHPKDTFGLLGQSLPQVCAFFACYLFIKAFCGLPLELCRGVAFGQQVVKRLVYPSSTARDRSHPFLGLRDVDNAGWFSLGKFGAQDLLVLCLVMTYAVMAPVILVPGLLFFAFAQVVYRHQLLFVYEPLFESGGLLWPRFYRRTVFALVVFQTTMTGLFFLKQCYRQGYAVLACSAITYAYKMHMKSMYATSSSVAHYLPMELATALDESINAASDQDKANDDQRLWNGLNDYLQPALR